MCTVPGGRFGIWGIGLEEPASMLALRQYLQGAIVSFLLRFPSDRPPTGFSQAELKGIWRFVRRAYLRDRIQALLLRAAALLLVVAGAVFWLLSGLK